MCTTRVPCLGDGQKKLKPGKGSDDNDHEGGRGSDGGGTSNTRLLGGLLGHGAHSGVHAVGGVHGVPPVGGVHGVPPVGGVHGVPPVGGIHGVPSVGGVQGVPPVGGVHGVPPVGGVSGVFPGGGVISPPSGSCRYWCQTPEGAVYCCEDANQPADPIASQIIKGGQCPPVRKFCPKFHGPPETCSSDGRCPGLDKCLLRQMP
ncbi:uncharacterized protein LOC143019148 [Oratosquilla oratoria]|uniref:uncharacterized protein LOC143019148 n=1 Tax=Oratosquilla oratoria TaxID=337810 RepID=UPI003F767C5F